jgi:phosphate starvation-inducible PhoH-like protein
VAKRAKRSNRFNPRQDRNSNDFNYTPRNIRTGKREDITRSNVIDFPHTPIKKRVEIIPRNLNQEDLLSALEDDKKHIVFATGPAGTGKTMLTTLHGIKMLKEGAVSKIVISRPNVAVDDTDIGYLPGDIVAKLSPWMMPILDVFAQYYSQKEIQALLEEKMLEMIPIAYIRGRTFSNSFIILDEAQNTTPSSMLSVLTRIGEGSKMVITGDVKQGDRGDKNGLSDFLNRFTVSDLISVVQFEQKDIVRHKVIPEILRMYGEI